MPGERRRGVVQRGSQFGKLFQRLQPAGYTPETFAGRTAHKFDAARLLVIVELHLVALIPLAAVIMARGLR